MSPDLYLAFVAACVVVAVIPGPMVALVVANSLSHGTRAGLLNVAGAQLGLALMLGSLVARGRVRLLSRLSGLCLIGGGVWLAVTRTR